MTSVASSLEAGLRVPRTSVPAASGLYRATSSSYRCVPPEVQLVQKNLPSQSKVLKKINFSVKKISFMLLVRCYISNTRLVDLFLYSLFCYTSHYAGNQLTSPKKSVSHRL